MTESDAQLARDIAEAFAQVPGLDPRPITDIHSVAWAEDGRTLSVYIDMPGGVTRIYSFCPGEPVSISDHP